MLRGWTRIWNDEETRLSYNRPSKQMKLFQIFCCDEIRVGVFPGIGGNIFVPALDEIKNISSYRRDLLRKLHSSLITDNRTNLAFEVIWHCFRQDNQHPLGLQVMMALLRTYTQVDAEKAKEDARECVRTAIADPNSFSVDHLLRLSAVQSLAESDPKIHKLLMLFSKGKLADYRRFIAENSSFVKDQVVWIEGVIWYFVSVESRRSRFGEEIQESDSHFLGRATTITLFKSPLKRTGDLRPRRARRVPHRRHPYRCS